MKKDLLTEAELKEINYGWDFSDEISVEEQVNILSELAHLIEDKSYTKAIDRCEECLITYEGVSTLDYVTVLMLGLEKNIVSSKISSVINLKWSTDKNLSSFLGGVIGMIISIALVAWLFFNKMPESMVVSVQTFFINLYYSYGVPVLGVLLVVLGVIAYFTELFSLYIFVIFAILFTNEMFGWGTFLVNHRIVIFQYAVFAILALIILNIAKKHFLGKIRYHRDAFFHPFKLKKQKEDYEIKKNSCRRYINMILLRLENFYNSYFDKNYEFYSEDLLLKVSEVSLLTAVDFTKEDKRKEYENNFEKLITYYQRKKTELLY